VVVVDALPRPGAAERDSGEWRARAVRLIRLGRTRLEEELKDPTVLADFAKDLGFSLAEKAGSCATAKALIWLRLDAPGYDAPARKSRDAGLSSGRLLGSIAAEGSPRIGRTAIERRLRSCTSPQFGSCLENFVIRPKCPDTLSAAANP